MPEWQIEDEECRRGKSRWAYQGGNGANRRRRMGSAASPGRQTSAQFASSASPLLRSSSKFVLRLLKIKTSNGGFLNLEPLKKFIDPNYLNSSSRSTENTVGLS